MKCSEIHPTRQNGELVDYLSSRFSPGLAYLHELLTIESQPSPSCFVSNKRLWESWPRLRYLQSIPLSQKSRQSGWYKQNLGCGMLRTCNTGSRFRPIQLAFGCHDMLQPNLLRDLIASQLMLVGAWPVLGPSYDAPQPSIQELPQTPGSTFVQGIFTHFSVVAAEIC